MGTWGKRGGGEGKARAELHKHLLLQFILYMFLELISDLLWDFDLKLCQVHESVR